MLINHQLGREQHNQQQQQHPHPSIHLIHIHTHSQGCARDTSHLPLGGLKKITFTGCFGAKLVPPCFPSTPLAYFLLHNVASASVGGGGGGDAVHRGEKHAKQNSIVFPLSLSHLKIGMKSKRNG